MQSNDIFVSFIIPVIRPEKAERCIAAIKEHCGLAEDKYEVLAEVDENRIGCPLMVKRLTDKSKGRLVCFLGDDTIPQPRFLEEALKVMDTLPDRYGLVGFADGTERDLPTHWIADKRLLPDLDWEFFHTGYKHCFCDLELRDRCRDMGRYAMAWDAIVKHDHEMLVDKEIADPDIKRVYSHEIYQADEALYYRRRRERVGFRLGIGLPIASNNVPVNFFVSFVAMEKPDYRLYLPKWTPGEFWQSIYAVRNDLVRQALDEGCSHLIMMDTDQIYPHDTITKLLRHGKAVVGTPVHRRYPPFDPILYRGDIGQFVHVPDAICYSGDLVSVDATGCGCILYDMGVFLAIPEPWFEFTVTDKGKPVGEDIFFCHKLKQAGYELYVDTSIQIGHMTTFVVTRETYELYKNLNNFRYREG